MTKYIVIIIFIILLLSLKHYETFQNSIIVNVYPFESHFGMGDYMRGIISLYQNNDWNSIYIDYSKNEIAKYLYNDTGTNYKTEKKPIYLTKDFVPKNGVNIIHYNSAIDYPIDPKIKKQVRSMFLMKPEFKQYFLNQLSELQLKKGNFVVLHIRYNDDVFNNDGRKQDTMLENKIVQLKSQFKNILLLSNSKTMKEYLSLKYKLKYFDTVPVHTGYIHSSTANRIKDTLVEFFAMTYSKIIYQYCEDKNQVSGFSKRINEFYDIPLIIL